ncbi:glycosyltransferase family 8 protein [Streptomyces sp. NPDC060184]|uniref:glycosyltransferase family 8 protein n=1 Tax=Streptomyces sp. NPDC060184 TaxID=3347064 RepID=UPI00364650EF
MNHAQQEVAEPVRRLVFAVDESYCLPLTVAWLSLRRTNPELADRLRIDVLYEELSDTAADRLRRHADLLRLQVTLRPVSLEPIRYPTGFGGANANYLRLVIPEIYRDCDKLLYLDSDLVIRGDLEGLLGTDLGGAPIGAVRDPLNPLVGRGRALPGWSKLGIPAEREYFNSGVLMIDPLACRSERLFERALAFIASHPEHIRLWDQDALNWAAEDRWHRLNPRWNVFPVSALLRTPWVRYTTEDVTPLDALDRLEEEAAVLHFASPAKPWKGLLPECPSAVLYEKLLDAVRKADHQLAADLR